MAGKYVITKSPSGKFHFNLKAGNGEIILSSQMYSAKASAINGIESVCTNAKIDERFERKVAKDGQHYFVLKARQGQVIGQSEMYKATSGMENGIRSVQKNCDSEIDDRTVQKD